jgi:hypothetical protein
VPRARRAILVRHHLARTVRPGTGRLLVSDYAARRSYLRRRSAAPATLAMIAANGGITSATIETTTAATVE